MILLDKKDKNNEIKKIKVVRKAGTLIKATVQLIKGEKPVCVETYADNHALGRVTLRNK